MGEIASLIPAALAVASFIPGPQQPFIAAAAALSGIALSFLGPKPKRGKVRLPDLPSTAQDRVQLVRSPVESHKIVYGTAEVGGPLVFVHTHGSSQEFLKLAQAYTGHEITQFLEFRVNDVVLNAASDFNADLTVSFPNTGTATTSKFANHLSASIHLGTDDQIANGILTSLPGAGWTGEHRLRGVAYAMFGLIYNRDIYTNGIPNLSAVVKGRKVWDPRDAGQDPDNPATHLFSNNWALCVLDYLRADFGLAAGLDEIDLPSFITAANISDEAVATGGTPASQARYSCDGVIDLEDNPRDIMQDLLSAGAGSLSYSQGKYHLFAGAYVTPVHALTVDDLAGEIQIQTRVERRELFNAVRGTFVDPAQFYQPTDFPPRENATFEAEDGGQQIFRDIELPFTQDSIRAQRIAEILLRKSRQGITLVFPAKLTALPIAVFDTVNVTLDSTGANFGWTDKVFRVLNKEFNKTGGINLTLQEEDSTSYDWDSGTAIAFDPAPDTALPDPFTVVHPGGLTMVSGDAELIIAGDGSVVSQIRATWSPPADIFVTENGKIELQYRRNDLPAPLDWDDGNTETRLVDGAATSTFLAPVKDGVTYDVRIRSINQLGVSKDAGGNNWGPVVQHTVVGKTERPSEPDSFSVARLADGTRRYEWTQANVPADVRVGGGYRIRYRLGTTADWDAMTPLHSGLLTTSPHESNELAAGSYTLAVKTVDSSGNESVAARFLQVTLGNPRLRDVLVARLEHDLGFPGDKADAFVESDGTLASVSLGGWDALPATWDGLAASWETILPSPAQIVYSVVIDVGADLSFTPLVSLEGRGTPALEMRTGAEGAGLPLTGPFGPLAPVTAQRFIEIRVTMTATQAPPEPTAIEVLTILLDGETKIEDFNDIDTSGPSGERFERLATGHFRIVPSELSIISQAGLTAIQNVGPGHSWELISKEALAFGPPGQLAAEFKLYDAAGALADAVIDVSLKGPKLT